MSSQTIRTYQKARSKTGAIRLYSPQQIAAATFVASAAAGGILLADNFYRLGRTGAAVLSGLGGIVVTALVVVMALNLPGEIPGMPFVIAQALGMFGVAKLTQGAAFAEHMARGGEMAKGWRPVVITLGTAIVMVGILLALFI